MSISNDSSKNNVTNAFKIYFFPTLVTILAMMIWRDVSELRSDVKALLAQSNVDKTKIENLEKDMRMIQQKVYEKPSASNSILRSGVYDKYFKHEDIFDVKKYIRYES